MLLALSGGCAPPPAVTHASPAAVARASAKWTFMVYHDAQNDLEKNNLDELRAMMAVGSTPDVTVIVLCGRSPDDNEDDGYSGEAVGNLANWKTCKLLRVDKGRLTELADWGDASMASGETLTRFVETVRRDFPAQRTALVLNDHGMAWQGCCGDESAPEGEDAMTLPALRDGLRRALKGERLDLIGFDACTMASFEVARELAPLAHIMTASEEDEPEEGWRYQPVLTRLTAQPSMDATALGRLVAETYVHGFEGDPTSRQDSVEATMSVIDLTRLAPLRASVDALGTACASATRSGRAGWLKMARARARTESYGTARSQDEESSDVYDLGAFAHAVTRLLPEAAPSARRVERALRDAVIVSLHGPARPQASGLSIFLPRRDETLHRADPLAYADVVGETGAAWNAFLDAYTTATEAEKTPPRLTNLTCVPRVASPGSPVRVTASTVPGEIDRAWLVLGDLDGSDSMIVGQIAVHPNARGQVSRTWDGRWYHLTHGDQAVVCSIDDRVDIDLRKGEFTARIPAELKRRGQKKWQDLTLHFFVRETGRGVAESRLLSAFTETRFGTREVTLGRGDRIRPLYREIEDNGEESLIYSDDREDQIEIGKDATLTLRNERLNPGKWRVGFVVSDHADHHTQAWTDVELRN